MIIEESINEAGNLTIILRAETEAEEKNWPEFNQEFLDRISKSKVIEPWLKEEGYLNLNYPFFIDKMLGVSEPIKIKEMRLTPDGIFVKTEDS